MKERDQDPGEQAVPLPVLNPDHPLEQGLPVPAWWGRTPAPHSLGARSTPRVATTDAPRQDPVGLQDRIWAGLSSRPMGEVLGADRTLLLRGA